jgi:hypothetical protein
MVRMLAVVDSCTLYVNVQINTKSRSGDSTRAMERASTLHLQYHRGFHFSISHPPHNIDTQQEKPNMLFQSLLSAALVVAVTSTATPVITDQKPILCAHEDLTAQQIDLIKE